MHQNMDHRRKASWSELPLELLSMIANRLDAPMDFLGFRSLCSSWRSSTSPPGHDQSGGGTDDLPSPPKFPCPFDSRKGVVVSESTIYRLEPLHDDDPDPSNSSSIPAKALLVKLEATKPGEYPLRIGRDDGSPSPIPKVLCWLDYRMVKLGKSNGLNYLNHNNTMAGVSKVIRYPDTASTFAEDCSIFVIYDGWKLGFAKRGDQELTLVDPGVSDYNDLIVHRGKLYVVDRRGTVSWMNYSSLKLTQISPTPSGSGARKHLVEYGGELYVVDRYFETKEQRLAAAASEAAEKQAPPHRPRRCRVICRVAMPRPLPHSSGFSLIAIRGTLPRGKTVDFKVYKLNKECGTWTEVTDLGDEAFSLSDDVSLSVSASEFEGCKKNCIYVVKDRYEGSLFSYAKDRCAFSLQDRSIQIFRWPMPLRYSNPQFNTRLWILDCSNIIKPPIELLTPTAS